MNSIPEQTRSTEAQYKLLEESAGWFPLLGWSLLELRGDDRLEWLQGQVTNEVRSLFDGQTISFCFCTPTGHVEAVVDAWGIGRCVWMVCETAAVPAILNRVEETVIMEEVEIFDRTSEFKGVSVQGPDALARFGDGQDFFARPCKGGWAFQSRRSRFGGVDLWLPEARARFESLADISVMEVEAVGILRLEAGLPRLGLDYDRKTLAPELGPDFVNRHISYTKGCYTGQEVIMRIYSRGHTNRTWVGLRSDEIVYPGDQVVGPEGDSMGKVTSSALSPSFGPIAAAVLKNEFAAPATELCIQTKIGPVRATVCGLPFD